MSTWLYLQCQDHNPPLTAEDESGQHLYDLPRIMEEIEDREQVALRWLERPYESSDLYFERNSAKFLAKHLDCNIRIIDEYGRYHD